MKGVRTVQRIEGDERGFIVGWLGKVAIAFVLVAIVIYDGGSIVVNFFTLDSKADEIAVQLTTELQPGTLSITTLEPQAKQLAQDAGARLVGLRLEGNILYVSLRRRARTLVVGRIGPIEDWARATVEGQAGTG